MANTPSSSTSTTTSSTTGTPAGAGSASARTTTKAVEGLVGVPPLASVDENPKAGPGQKVVESPTGTKSVVEEDAVALLKTQGYKVRGGD